MFDIAFLVLLVTRKLGKAYGAQISEEIQRLTSQRVGNKGSLYSVLTGLEEGGYIRMVRDVQDSPVVPGRPRVFYSLTAKGEKRLNSELDIAKNVLVYSLAGSE